MTTRKEDRGAYLGALLMKRVPASLPGTVAQDVAELRRKAKALDWLGVKACNWGLDARAERRRDKLAAEVRCLASGYALDAETSGDPRGCVVKLVDPANESAGDGWGGGWPVY